MVHCGKQLLKVVNTELPWYPATPFLRIDPRELEAGTQNRYTHIHGSFTPHSQKVGATQVSVHGGVGQCHMVSTFNGLAFSFKRPF